MSLFDFKKQNITTKLYLYKYVNDNIIDLLHKLFDNLWPQTQIEPANFGTAIRRSNYRTNGTLSSTATATVCMFNILLSQHVSIWLCCSLRLAI